MQQEYACAASPSPENVRFYKCTRAMTMTLHYCPRARSIASWLVSRFAQRSSPHDQVRLDEDLAAENEAHLPSSVSSFFIVVHQAGAGKLPRAAGRDEAAGDFDPFGYTAPAAHHSQHRNLNPKQATPLPPQQRQNRKGRTHPSFPSTSTISVSHRHLQPTPFSFPGSTLSQYSSSSRQFFQSLRSSAGVPKLTSVPSGSLRGPK